MGQALRRATGGGRLRPSDHRLPPTDIRPPPVVPTKAESRVAGQDHVSISDPESIPKVASDQTVLEERDPGYDAMLSKMVGRITSKPGGKLEMGEAFIVEKYNRPLPKLRSSKSEQGGDGQNSSPPGTLTAAQLQEIILLHQGKSENQIGPMPIDDIAQKFRVDSTYVARIVQFLSLPLENNTKTSSNEGG